MADSKVAGCLFGMALGDALGAETEFLNMEAIYRQFPPRGPLEPAGEPALVTDDTQMALAVGEALVKAPKPYAPDTLAEQLQIAFIDWYNSPDNTRAPGATCLTSVENLISGQPWHEATSISSKGCGANMRVMPVGLLNVDPVTRAAIAQFQAAITHGHPTGLAASDLTAFVVAELRETDEIYSLPYRVREYAELQRGVYHQSWLDNLWERVPVMRSAEQFMEHGWDECLAILEKLERAVLRKDIYSDPCTLIGAGWIAEEAFATALFCFLMFPDDPIGVMQRAATSSGDSDTIACIAGSFAGTYNGVEALPQEWIQRIEYRERLQNLAESLSL